MQLIHVAYWISKHSNTGPCKYQLPAPVTMWLTGTVIYCYSPIASVSYSISVSWENITIKSLKYSFYWRHNTFYHHKLKKYHSKTSWIRDHLHLLFWGRMKVSDAYPTILMALLFYYGFNYCGLFTFLYAIFIIL
jgi:hypothetical protein